MFKKLKNSLSRVILMIVTIRVYSRPTYIGVCVCCAEEGDALAEEWEVGGGWGVEDKEEVEPEAAVATDEVSVLCVIKRRRSFIAGRKVMMSFST